MDQTYIDTAHLLRRAGFGAEPAAIRSAAQAGLSATTDSLLHPERIPETLDDDATLARLTSLLPETKNGGTPTQAVKMWWTHRMIASAHPLQEKMTLFWHGHFTSKDGNMAGDLLYRQNQMLRRNALGNFRSLTLAVARDPEMLRYLNGNQNHKAQPNENFARELMELYTCGIGNYTEDDVKAGARAFSGWNLRGEDFTFNTKQHDNDQKTFMGKTGNWNGDDIVDILVALPATARRVCTQLFTYFAYPDPEPAVLDSLVKTYFSSGYDIRAIMSQILHSQAFYSDKARLAVIKTPAQYVVGTIRLLGMDKAVELILSDVTPTNDMAANPAAIPAAGASTAPLAKGRRLGVLASLPLAMRAMGQDLLAPPTVKGWDGGENWINTSTLLARINFADVISRSREMFGSSFPSAVEFMQQHVLTPEGWVDYLAETLGPLPITPSTRQALISYVQSPDLPTSTVVNVQLQPGRRRRAGRLNGDGPGGLEGRLRGVIPLLMATPEYQVC